MLKKSVIISGRPVSGKTAVANALSAIFGAEVFSIGKLWKEEWQRKYTIGEVTFEEYWRNTSPEENRAMDLKAKAILEATPMIGDLRFAELTKDPKIFKVFLDADMDVRTKRAKTRPGYTHMPDRDMRELLLSRERDELRMCRLNYGKRYDYREPLNYHLVLNSSLLTLEQEVEIIADSIKLFQG